VEMRGTGMRMGLDTDGVEGLEVMPIHSRFFNV